MSSHLISRRSALHGAAACGLAALAWPRAALAGSNETFVKRDLTALFDTAQGAAVIASFSTLVGASPAAGLARYLSEKLAAGTLTALDFAMLALAADTAEPKLQAALRAAFTRTHLTAEHKRLITAFWRGASDTLFVQTLQAAASFIATPANFPIFQDFATAAPVTEIQDQSDVPAALKTAPNVAPLDDLVAAIRAVGTNDEYLGMANLIYGVTRQPAYAQALLDISPLASTLLVPYESLAAARAPLAPAAGSAMYQCRIPPAQAPSQMLGLVGACVAQTVIVAGLAAAAIAADDRRPVIPLLQIVTVILGAGDTVGVSELAALAAIFPDCDNDLDNVLTQDGSGERGDNECRENGCNGSPPTVRDRLHSLIERADAERSWRAAGRKVDMFHLPKYPRLPILARGTP
jgi:hypothetical protein